MGPAPRRLLLLAALCALARGEAAGAMLRQGEGLGPGPEGLRGSPEGGAGLGAGPFSPPCPRSPRAGAVGRAWGPLRAEGEGVV